MKKQSRLKWLVVVCYLVMYLITARLGITCVWKALFGMPCPGCGYTRAVWAALHGQLGTAWRYHPLFFLLPLLAILFFTDANLFKKDWLNNGVLIAVAVAFIAVWVIRLICGTLPA